MLDVNLSGNGYEIVDYVTLSIPHLKEVLRIKNLPEFVCWDKDAHKVSWNEHLNFISSLRGDDTRKYYAVFKDGEYIGTINFRKEHDGVWSRGIGTVPSFQGKGETEKWERQVLYALPKDIFKKLTADVKLDNLRSIRYHQKMGFVEIGRDKNYVYYEKVL